MKFLSILYSKKSLITRGQLIAIKSGALRVVKPEVKMFAKGLNYTCLRLWVHGRGDASLEELTSTTPVKSFKFMNMTEKL